MSQTIHPNPFSRSDSSGQLPSAAPVTIPHPQSIPHPSIPHPSAGQPPIPHPSAGGFLFGNRTNKSKLPRGGHTNIGGVPVGAHPFPGLHGGIDNRFITDRHRFGLTSFRPILSVEERARFLSLIHGCVGCNIRLLYFIFGVQYFPEFANIGFCTGRPTSCGIWILGVNGCWFKVSPAEAAVIAQFGGPPPISIPCTGIQTVVGVGPAFGFGRFNRRPFGPALFPGHRNSFPFGGVHPGGPHGFPGSHQDHSGLPGGRDGQGQDGGFHPGGNAANSGNTQGGQGAGVDGREHAAPGS